MFVKWVWTILVAATFVATPLRALSCKEWLLEAVPQGAATAKLLERIDAYALTRATFTDGVMRAARASGAPLNGATAERYLAGLDLISGRNWDRQSRADFVFRAMLAHGRNIHSRHAVVASAPLIAACSDPFGIEQSLVPPEAAGNDPAMVAAANIAELFRMPVNHRLRLVEPLARWTRTPAHAAYLHHLLSTGGIAGGAELLRAVAEKTSAFGNAYWLPQYPGVPVTFGFEKESMSPRLARLYRLAEVSPEDWLQNLSQSPVQELLRRANVADAIAPMPGIPRALGPFRIDATVAEIAHRHYDVDPDAFFRSLREVSRALGETDGFHLHVAFELPREYSRQLELGEWWVHANHYLLFRGLEEGLAPSLRVGVASLAEGQSFATEKTPWLKMFSLGFRGGKFGPALAKDAVRLSLELRDATRNLDLLESDARWLAESVVGRVWERKQPASALLALRFPRQPVNAPDRLLLGRMGNHVQADSWRLVELALAPYETGEYFDYGTGKSRRVSTATRRRVVMARHQLRSEIEILVQEFERREPTPDRVSSELATDVIRWTVVEWAQRVRLSELYAGVRPPER